MIVFACDWCGKSYKVDSTMTGRDARCRKCGGVTPVPEEPARGADLELAPEPAPRPAAGPAAVPLPYAIPRRRGGSPKPANLSPVWGGIDRDGWVSLGIGLVVAVIVLLVPQIGFFLFPLKTIIHESGHTAAAWLLASPAFPQFDLTYGGGYTHILGRQPILVLVIYAALAYGLFLFRTNRPVVIAWITGMLLYTVAMFTPLRDLVILAMGHLSETAFAGLFLYRAVSGSQILSPAERPLYAALGFFFVLLDSKFAGGLVTDQMARNAYGDAKGGGHWMDFDRIAKTVGCPLELVAGLFLAVCVLTPAAAYAVHRYGRWFLYGDRSFLTPRQR